MGVDKLKIVKYFAFAILGSGEVGLRGQEEPAPNRPTHGSPFKSCVGSGFGALQREPHPHCARLQTLLES
jgi:hypothetical protein